MPDHYDVDIYCKICGRYISSRRSSDDKPITPDDRICRICKICKENIDGNV